MQNSILKTTIFNFWIFILTISGNIYGQNPIKSSLFLAGNTSSTGSENQDRFLRELTNIDHPYSFVFLGNYSDSRMEDQELKFSFYPNNFSKSEMPLYFAPGPNEWGNNKKHTKKVINALHKQFPNNPVYTTDWGCPGPTEIEVND